MTTELLVNKTADGDSGVWYQSSRNIETGERRSIRGTFAVYGTPNGATVKLLSLIAGHWFDVPTASFTAEGLVTVEVFADAIKANQASSGGSTNLTAVFVTTEKLVDDKKLAVFVYA